ncbi:MAG: hypothetical protein WCL00_00235 [Bacteroidota bacterium]
MILTYSREKFKEKRLSGSKIHTIREDRHNRWKQGMMAHEWLHNPRNVSKNPHHFKTDQVQSIQRIEIIRTCDYLNETIVKIDDRKLKQNEVQELAWNDGFENLADFWLFFADGFDGRILHFTDKRY